MVKSLRQRIPFRRVVAEAVLRPEVFLREIDKLRGMPACLRICAVGVQIALSFQELLQRVEGMGV